MQNTDKLCLFTASGSMYQIKAMSIPKVRSRDKGVLIQSLCKVGHEDILAYIPFEDLFESQVLFVTKNGFVKLVSGIEFDTNRSMIASTKLEDDDALVCVKSLSVEESVEYVQNVIMITTKGASLAFPLDEVNEFKKTSKGLKGIALPAGDSVLYSTTVTPDIDDITFEGKHYNPQKIKIRKRNDKPTKTKITC